MPEVTLAAWKRFLENHPQAHFLQTGEWGELKAQFGWQAVRLIVGESGAQLLFRRLPLGLTLGYLAKPAPGQVRAQDAAHFWADVDATCRHRRAIFCRVEGDAWEGTDSADSMRSELPWPPPTIGRRSPHNIQPRRTILVDLTPSEEAILGRMKQKCRYNIRLAEKKGVTVAVWDDLEGFHQMMRSTGIRDGFGVHAASYYRRAYDLFHASGMSELLMASHEGQSLAALMVFARGRRAWYVYGGSTGEERARMPNHLLQWEAMRWAKRRGCEEYDLWGVPDDDESTLEEGFSRRRDGLWGVYRFKRGFGGELRRAIQAVDRVYQLGLYTAYSFLAPHMGMQ